MSDAISMTDSWKSLEGVTFAEKFQLQTLLFENGAGACFLTRIVGGPQPTGWLWLVLADGTTDVKKLENWQIVAGLSHPNLLHVWEAGRGERGVTSMVYLLTEPADDDLAAVLSERPLNQLEAREALLNTAKALSYLHSRALVHGKVEPATILAVDENIRLTADTIAPAAENPESGLSPSDDLRALGNCVHAMFTQSLNTDLEHLSGIPQPFRDIIRGCYGVNPTERWTAQRIVAILDPPPVPVIPAADVAEPAAADSPRPASRRRIPAWVFAPAAVAVAFMVVLLARKPEPASPPPALPAAGSRITRAPEPAPAPELPSPLGPVIGQPPPKKSDATPSAKPSTAPSHVWRVVSYTYSKAEDAARMVGNINRKWPNLRAEQFTPNGSGPPYYVSLGGRMSRSEAQRVQQRAISSGLPQDTFVRNFKK